MTIMLQKIIKRRLFEDGIPATMFGVDDIRKEYDKVIETRREVYYGTDKKWAKSQIAVFDDTCGNLIQINTTVTDKER